MAETWLPLPDYEGLYEISSEGRVRSLYFEPPRLLKLISDSNGYPVVMLSKDGKRTPKTVHRLVCRAFHGEPEEGLEAAHLDGVRVNCRATNLGWVTRRDNINHKFRHGTAPIGARHPRAKLTESDVRIIRASSTSRVKLAERFGVHRCAIDDIKNGRRWSHLAD